MNNGEIAISTAAFPGKNIADIEKIALDSDLIIEFSSGVHFEENIIKKFEKLNCERLIHNYFPPPENPFTLNLASLDSNIRKKSIDHALGCLRLAKKCGIPFYSVHAGYCVDPNPEQLGTTFISNTIKIKREENWKFFEESIHILLREAKILNITILIENNVVTKENIPSDGLIPLLCSDPDDMFRLFNKFNDKHIGLLLDTAHLKISSVALNFDPEKFIYDNRFKIIALHHSDNNGFSDENLLLGDDYWFLKYMSDFRDQYHILEINKIPFDMISQQKELLKKAMKLWD